MRLRFRYLLTATAMAAIVGAPAAAAQPDPAPTPADQPGNAPAAVAQPAQDQDAVARRDHEHFKLIWPSQSCNNEGPWGTDVMCESPGNVQINDSLPVFGGALAGDFYL